MSESWGSRLQHQGLLYHETGDSPAKVRRPVVSKGDDPVTGKSIWRGELHLESSFFICRQGRYPDSTGIEVPAWSLSFEVFHEVPSSTDKETLVEGMSLPRIFGEDFAKGCPGLGAETARRVKMGHGVRIDVTCNREGSLVFGV